MDEKEVEKVKASTVLASIEYTDKLPVVVKVLPYDGQNIWMTAYNAALEEYKDETKASDISWEAVRMKGYFKVGNHWMVRAAMQPVNSTIQASLYASAEADGSKWKVRVIQAGMDLRGRYWPFEVLKTCIPVFEGMKVFMLSEAQHQDEKTKHKYGKPPGEMVGWFSEVAAVDDGLYGNFNVLDSDHAKCLKKNLVCAYEKGKSDLYGLSIDVIAAGQVVENSGRGKYFQVCEIEKGTCDVVYDPAAGGNFISMAAAQTNLEDKKETVMDEEEKKALLKAKQDMQVLMCSVRLEKSLFDAKLPEPVNAKLKKRFEGKIFDEVELKAALVDEKECLDKIQAVTITAAGDVRLSLDDMDKRKLMFDDFFEEKPNARSFKACYVNYTGDENLTGQRRECKRLTAAMDSTSLSIVLQDSMNKRMVAEYRSSAYSKDWRKLCSVVPKSDFRTQHVTRMGGYGDLPVVAEGNPYTAASSPTDEQATYALIKRGYTEAITFEMLRNDDVGVIRKIPRKIATACSRQIYEFVFAFLSDNPTIYDSAALFTTGKGNLGTVALDETNLNIRRRAMLNKTELSSGKKIGVPAKYLIVPTTLDKTAYELVAQPRNSDFDPTAVNFTRTLNLELIVNNLWTDANNWYLMASPNDIEGLELAFLDGREEPEMFVQDQESVGSVFTNDKITYKWRHIYNGAIVDYRGFDGSIVA